MDALQIVFWFSAALLALPHFLYPPLLFVLARLRRERSPGSATPSVTLVISAYNEAAVIRQKLENALSLDYPAHLLEIMVISDASSDGTDEIIAARADSQVSLCRQEKRAGKSAGLTRFCPQARGDILVFTDANSMFRPDALRKLVRHFDDPQVGYTVGQQLYDNTQHGASADSENVYWGLELQLKAWESRLSSVVGADGAIYALRKELFEPLAAEDINDFLLPLKVVVKGYRGVFDREAVCTESAAPDFRGEFRRKYRIVNRSLRAVLKAPGAFNPARVGWFAFQLFAHKLVRWLSPVFLVLLLISSGWLASHETGRALVHRPFTIALILQALGYGLAIGYAIPLLRNTRVVYVAFYFLMVNVAAAVGLGLLMTGRAIGVWKPQR